MAHDIQLADFRAAWAANAPATQAAIARVGESGWLVLGKEVLEFEKDLAKVWGLKHSIGVANGLDALEISFRVLGAKPGDRYLTTPLSAFATTLAILRAGGVPEFVDVDATGLIDLDLVEQRLADGKRPPIRFFVPVHLFGHALPVERLRALSSRHGVTLIEDCAQAIGAKSGGLPVGAASPICATSFYPTKNLGALGDGGAILTNDDSLAADARCLRDYGQTDKYVHARLGMNSRLDELHAAILRSVQLPALAAQTERRRAISARYRRELKTGAFALPPEPPGSDSVWHLFPLLVNTAGEREPFRAHLKAQQVATGLHYPMLIPAQQAMAEAGQPVLPAESFPRANQFARCEVSIPLHPFLSDDDCARVIAACNSYRP